MNVKKNIETTKIKQEKKKEQTADHKQDNVNNPSETKKLEIFTIGGYNEVGMNMTAIKIGEEVVIIDLGLNLDKYREFTENEDIVEASSANLWKAGAVPDISMIENLRNKVIAIIPTHGHLDHLGAIPFMAKKFPNATIYGTQYTCEILKSIIKDNGKKIKNKISALPLNSKLKISDNIKCELINVTHSIPQASMVFLEGDGKRIIYANDYKFDNTPTLGKKTKYKRIEELGKKGIDALILDSTYSKEARKMPSENIAKEMLADVMLNGNYEGNAMVVTTFSSHIARLKSIIEFSKKMGRKPIFLGRSLSRYVGAAEKCGIINFSKDTEMIKYGTQISSKLKKISDETDKYVLIMTGHQGETNATLSKILNDKIKFNFKREDAVIFSCPVIPSPTNIANRKIMEEKLKHQGVRIFKDIHVSGHAGREDQRELIKLSNPDHIIPAHGDISMTSALSELAEEMGYRPGTQIHLMQNGQKLEID